MNLVEEHIKLSNGILAGDLSVEQVKNEIARIEKEYGTDSFDSYKVKKKSAPWTEADLDDLEIQSASGACSKEFYLNMAEVSEFVHKKYKKNGWIGCITSFLKFVAYHWLIILFCVGLFILFCWGISKIFG